MSKPSNHFSRSALAIVLVLATASAGCLICLPTDDASGVPILGAPANLTRPGFADGLACLDPLQSFFLLFLGFAPQVDDGYTPPASLRPERAGQEADGGYLAMTLRPAGDVVDSARIGSNIRAFDVVQEPMGAAEARLASEEAPLRRIFLSDADGRNVLVVDPVSRQVSASILVGRSPHGLAFSPDGSRLYVANRDSDSISVVDTTTLAVTESLSPPSGGSLIGLAVTPDGSKLYAVNGADAGAVVVFDLAGGGPSHSVRVGRRPTRIRLTPDGSTAFVANTGANSVSVLDTRTDTLTAALNVDRPSDLAVSPDGNFIYALSASASGRVLEISVATLRETRSWEVGDTPLGLILLPGGSQLLATNSRSPFMSLVDLTSGRAVIRIAAPLGLGSAAAVLLEDRPPLSAGM
jgi:YVTN family beta-propeller protein